MAYPDEMRLAVRKSYVYARMSLQSAADAHDVNYQTARTFNNQRCFAWAISVRFQNAFAFKLFKEGGRIV